MGWTSTLYVYRILKSLINRIPGSAISIGILQINPHTSLDLNSPMSLQQAYVEQPKSLGEFMKVDSYIVIESSESTRSISWRSHSQLCRYFGKVAVLDRSRLIRFDTVLERRRGKREQRE